jgi:large subunit ribosomal protein L13
LVRGTLIKLGLLFPSIKNYNKNFTKRFIIVHLQPVETIFNGFKIFIVNTQSYKTISANPNTVNKEWVLVDVKGLPLGRVSAIIANFLRGKYKTNFTPHVDCGDNVIVVNAAHVTLSGNKWEQKEYIRHTGYPGGQRKLNATQLHNKRDTRLVENAVRGMLPKNKLGAELFRNLRVFGNSEHEQDAQNPKTININEFL